MIQLLRQFSVLHSDKKQISIGLVGYPNVGKSSVINTLKKKKVCTVAPIPGETKVWQYVALMRRIYLVDCPGIVPIGKHDSETDTVLKGVVRVENLETPAEHVPALLNRVKKEYIQKTYNVKNWKDHEDFLGQIAKRMGKLLKGGEPDYETVAKMVLNDWIRGKIPYFAAPPEPEKKDLKGKSKAVEKPQAVHPSATSANNTPVDLKKRVKGVEQPLRQIAVLSKFDKEDNTGGNDEDFEMDKEDGEEEAELANSDDEQVEDDEEEEEEESDDDVGLEELKWEDVFAGNGEYSNIGDVSEEEEDDDDEDDADVSRILEATTSRASKKRNADVSFGTEDQDQDQEVEEKKSTTKKEPRMTTSKRKAENYYTHANVKNKNKNKVVIPNEKKKRERGPPKVASGKRKAGGRK